MNRTRAMAVALITLACGASWAWSEPQAGALPDEVVVKGEEVGRKVGATKPPLSIKIDPYESIRPSLDPDRNLFLAQSRSTVGWRAPHPQFLLSPHVVEAWRSVFTGRTGVTFNLLHQLQEVMPNPISDRDARNYAWNLT